MIGPSDTAHPPGPLPHNQFGALESFRAPSEIMRYGAILAAHPRYANGATSKIWSVHTAAFLG